MLRELQIGDKLFADPGEAVVEAEPGAEWPEFISRLYRGDFEPNTREETEILTRLIGYITDLPDRDPRLIGLLQQLLPLRSRFPAILDPQGAEPIAGSERAAWATDANRRVWRGAVLSPKRALEFTHGSRVRRIAVSGAQSMWHSYLRDPTSTAYAYVITSPTVTYRSAGGPMISFTANPRVAHEFAARHSGRGDVPVIFGISRRDPDLIMNPDAMNALTGVYQEHETLLLRNQFRPEVVIFITPYSPKYIRSLV